MDTLDAGRLHALARELRAIASSATADAGERVSPGVIAVVEDVASRGATTIGEIASETGFAQSLVSKIVAELHEAGVLVTERDPHDRRRVLVTVNERFRSDVLVSRGSRPVDDALHARHPQLTATKVRRVLALLDELAAILSPRHGER